MKRTPFVFLLFVLCIFTSTFARHFCGTTQIIQNIHEHGQNASIKNFYSTKAPLAYTSSTICHDNDLYGSVLTQTTEHFEIFYTLDGPHKTTQEYIDSLSKHLEFAWNFHVKKLGMLPPLGPSSSYHYQQDVLPGLYPIEVIDIALLRNSTSLLNGACHGCFGLTLPFDSTQSEVLIDNDFRYAPENFQTTDSVTYNGKRCPYPTASQELHNSAHHYSYVKEWNQGLRVTTAHELFHAVQLRYLDLTSFSIVPFWFEASATGIEEIVIPDVDDYFSYLRKFTESTGISLNNMSSDYGAGLLFIYLYNHVGKNTAKFIWESYATKPAEPFQYHLTKYANKNKLSADSLFHDFAIRLSFTGNKASLVDSSFWIDQDQPHWPEFKAVKATDHFEVYPLDELAYRFYANGKPELSKFTGRASAISITDNRYRIRFLPNTNSIDSVYIESVTASTDSIIWIFSRFTETDRIPTILKDSTLRAFPTPWRHGKLCFMPLPLDKDYIEIRNRRGNLIEKIKYDNYMHCLDESEVKSLLVPGVYRFRIGNSGKLKDFIIVY